MRRNQWLASVGITGWNGSESPAGLRRNTHRWRTLAREQGNVRPGALGGDRRSGRIEAQAALVLRLLDEMRDTTIEELRQALGERGHRFGYGTLRRFFKRHRITRKKRQAMPPSRTVPTS
jgi:transposase